MLSLLTDNLEVAELALHGLRVDLAHVPPTVPGPHLSDHHH